MDGDKLLFGRETGVNSIFENPEILAASLDFTTRQNYNLS
jgi:hypothetical protein